MAVCRGTAPPGGEGAEPNIFQKSSILQDVRPLSSAFPISSMRRALFAALLLTPLLGACGRHTAQLGSFGPLKLPALERVVEVPARLEEPYVNCLVQVATEAGYQLINFDEASKRYEMDKGFSMFLDRRENPTDTVERLHFWIGAPADSAKRMLPVHLRLASFGVKTHAQVETRATAADDFRRITDGCVVNSPSRQSP